MKTAPLMIILCLISLTTGCSKHLFDSVDKFMNQPPLGLTPLQSPGPNGATESNVPPNSVRSLDVLMILDFSQGSDSVTAMKNAVGNFLNDLTQAKTDFKIQLLDSKLNQGGQIQSFFVMAQDADPLTNATNAIDTIALSQATETAPENTAQFVKEIQNKSTSFFRADSEQVFFLLTNQSQKELSSIIETGLILQRKTDFWEFRAVDAIENQNCPHDQANHSEKIKNYCGLSHLEETFKEIEESVSTI